MQDEIVSRLANTLDAQLIEAEARRAERSRPDATDLIFQGRAWFNKGMSAEHMAQARAFFERALVLDPRNIEALVGTAALRRRRRTVLSRPFICAAVIQVTECSTGIRDNDRHCSLEHQADGDRR